MLVKFKQSGFTLIELIIVLAILAVVAAYAVPSYQQMIQNSMIRTSAESIHSGLQIARSEAVKRNGSVQFDLRGTDSAWTVCVTPSPAAACPAGDNIQSRSAADGSSANIDITVNDASAAGPFTFNSLGVMTSPASTDASGIISIDVENGALVGTRDLRMVILGGGGSRLCDPALPSAGTDPRRCP